jgi:hypothetical protein
MDGKLVENKLALFALRVDQEAVHSIFFRIASIVLCFFLLQTFVFVSGVNHLAEASFPKMIFGQANRPYVNRALLPGTVRLLSSAIPEPARKELNAILMENPVSAQWLEKLLVPPEFATEGMLALILMFGSLLGFCFAFSRLFQDVFEVNPSIAQPVTLFSLVFLVFFFGFGYIYDFTTLFLFTFAQVLMIEKKWKSYLILFPFVCLNKETAIMLPVVFSFYYFRRMDRSLLFRLLDMQLIIFGLVQAALVSIFINNPGGFIELHFGDHILAMQKFPLLSILSALIILVILFLVFYKWNQKPAFLRYCAAGIIPLMVFYIFFGFPFEIRVFYEFFAVIAGLCFFPIIQRMKMKFG